MGAPTVRWRVAAAALLARGISAEAYVHPTTPLYDARFTRVAGIDSALSTAIATSLRGAGFVDAEGGWLVGGEQAAGDLGGLGQHDHQGGDLETHGLVNVKHLGQGDARLLRVLIQKHHSYTGSERARTILDDWNEYLPKFVKVMPVEYRQALQKMAVAQEARAKLEHASHG